jgi:hypothetical protein
MNITLGILNLHNLVSIDLQIFRIIVTLPLAKKKKRENWKLKEKIQNLY